MEGIFGLLFDSAWIAFSASLAYVVIAGLGSLLRSALGRPAPRTGRLHRATILMVASAIVGTLFFPAFVIIAPFYSAWITWYSVVALITGDLREVPWFYVGMVLTAALPLWLYVNGTFGRWIDAVRRRRVGRREVRWNF